MLREEQYGQFQNLKTCIPELNENIFISPFLGRDEERRKLFNTKWSRIQYDLKVSVNSYFLLVQL